MDTRSREHAGAASQFTPPVGSAHSTSDSLTSDGLHAAPEPAMATSRWGLTSLGMDASVAAGLAYLPVVGVVFFFLEKSNRFVKFHAAQVILLAIVATALGLLDRIAQAALFASPAIGSSAALNYVANSTGCVFGLAFLGVLSLWLWGLVSGFTGRYTKLSLIGELAQRWAGGAPIPAC